MGDKDWWGWLGIRKDQIYNWSVGPFITFFLVLFCLFIIALLSYHTIAVLAGIVHFDDPINQSAAARNYALIIAAVIGFPIIIWRTTVAQKQAVIAEQGHITDRINQAVLGLAAEKTVKHVQKIQRFKKDNGEWSRDKDGAPIPAIRPDNSLIFDIRSYEETVPNLEVRNGAILALERISQDSIRDHLWIMEMLCAYIRSNSPVTKLESSGELTIRPEARSDIQTAIQVLGRRNESLIEFEAKNHFRIDLRNSNLSGLDFSDKNFAAAIMAGCVIEGAIFDRTNLRGAIFARSILNYSEFSSADMTGSILDHAIINLPQPKSGAVSYSISMAEIYGMSLVGADISAINALGNATKRN